MIAGARMESGDIIYAKPVNVLQSLYPMSSSCYRVFYRTVPKFSDVRIICCNQPKI